MNPFICNRFITIWSMFLKGTPPDDIWPSSVGFRGVTARTVIEKPPRTYT